MVVILDINHVFHVVRVDILHIREVLLILLIARHIRIVINVHPGLLSCSFAQGGSTIRVRERTTSTGSFRTISGIGVVGAFEDVALVTTLIVAIANTRESSTNKSSRRDMNMRISACIIRAVAAKEMSARWGVGIRGRVAEVAFISSRARGLEEFRAHADFVGIVGETTHRAAGTVTYAIC